MPFTDVTELLGTNNAPVSRLAVQAKTITFRIDPKVLAEVGWSHGTRLRILRGWREEAGLVELRTAIDDAKGWQLARAGGGSNNGPVLKIPKLYNGEPIFEGQPDRLKPTGIEIQTLPDALRITLPWAEARRKSKPRKPPPVAETEPVVTAPIEPPAAEPEVEQAEQTEQPAPTPAAEPIPEPHEDPWTEERFAYAKQLDAGGAYRAPQIAALMNTRFQTDVYTEHSVRKKFARAAAKAETNGGRLAPALLAWFRDNNVRERAATIHWTLGQDPSGTKLLLNGNPLPPHTILARLNEALDLHDDDRLLLPAELMTNA